MSSWWQGGRRRGLGGPDTQLTEGSDYGQALSQRGAAQNKEHAWGHHHGLLSLHSPQWASVFLSVRWGHWTRVRAAPFADCQPRPVLGGISWQLSQVDLTHFTAGEHDIR